MKRTGHHNEMSNGKAWLNPALLAFHAGDSAEFLPENSVPDFEKRCQDAVLRGLDVLRMRRCEGQVRNSLGPLIEHFRAVARLAGVKLEGIFTALSIRSTSPPDAASAHGLARLARYLGLGCEEALFRLRLDFALTSRTSVKAELNAALSLEREREVVSNGDDFAATQAALRRCEGEYSHRRRKELRRVGKTFTEAFDMMR